MNATVCIPLVLRYYEEHPNERFCVPDALERCMQDSTAFQQTTREVKETICEQVQSELLLRCRLTNVWICTDDAPVQFEYHLQTVHSVAEVLEALHEAQESGTSGMRASAFSNESVPALSAAIDSGAVLLLAASLPPTVIACGVPGHVSVAPRIEVVTWHDSILVHETVDVRLRLLPAPQEEAMFAPKREDVQLHASWSNAVDIRPAVRDVSVNEIAHFTLRAKAPWIGVLRVTVDNAETLILPVQAKLNPCSILRESRKLSMLYASEDWYPSPQRSPCGAAVSPCLIAQWHAVPPDTTSSELDAFLPCKTYGDEQDALHSTEEGEASDNSLARRKRFLAATLSAVKRQQRGLRDRLHNRHMRVFGLDCSIPFYQEDQETKLRQHLKEASDKAKVATTRLYDPTVRVSKRTRKE